MGHWPATLALASLTALGAAPQALARDGTDWTTYAFDNQRPGYNPEEKTLGTGNVRRLHVSWTGALGGPATAQPLVATGVAVARHDLVYEGTLNGHFVALDRGTGDAVWRTTIQPLHSGCQDYPNGVATIIDTAVLDRGRHTLYLGARDGQVHALDEASGAERPGFPNRVVPEGLADLVIAGVTEVGRSVYVETASACDEPPYRGLAARVDAASGKLLDEWFPLGKHGPYGGAIWGSGGISAEPGGGALYVAVGNALAKNQHAGYAEHVVRLTPSLHPTAANYPGLTGPDVDFGATPLLYQAKGCPAQLAVMNKTGALFVYDRDRIGRGPRQRLQMANHALADQGDFIGLPAYDPKLDILYVNNPSDSSAGTYKHGLVALRVGKGCKLELAWQQTVGGQATEQVEYPSISPTVANGVVYAVRSLDSTVYAFDAASGERLWDSGDTIKGGIFAAVTVANGQLLVAGFDGKLRAFEAR